MKVETQPSSRRPIRSRRSLNVLTGFLRPASGSGRPETGIDWHEVLLLASEHRLAPAVFVALKRTDRLSELPAEVRAHLGRLHRLNRSRNRALRKQAIELVAACNARDVPVMVLKGAASLFDPTGREPGARMVRDIDLMIRDAALTGTLSVFESIGYRAVHRHPPGHAVHVELVRPGSAGAVALHVSPTGSPRFFDAAEMWRRASVVRVEGARLWLPQIEDRILHDILLARSHARGADGHGDIELRQLHDLALRATADGDLDWRSIESRMRAAGLGVILESRLLSAHRLFGLKWPLSRPPGWRAAIHHKRCIIQILIPALGRIAFPPNRLLGALARGIACPGVSFPGLRRHRMRTPTGAPESRGRRFAHRASGMPPASAAPAPAAPAPEHARRHDRWRAGGPR